jgi:hypothetical protein
VFARADCSASQRSVPAIRQVIAGARSSTGVGVRLVTPAGDSSGADSLGRALGLQSDEIVQLEDHIRLDRVPALAIVDQSGTILRFWQGTLTDSDVTPIAQLVSSLSTSLR